MRCMKCGKKIDDQQSFCGECLEDMEKYPVKPTTTIYLPTRASAQQAKKNRRNRESKPEEQLRRANKTIRWLAATLAAVLLCLAVTVFMLFRLIDQQDNAPGIGQNYGSMTDADK